MCAATYGKEAPTLTLDQRDFLPPAPKDNADDEGDEISSWWVSCIGVLCSRFPYVACSYGVARFGAVTALLGPRVLVCGDGMNTVQSCLHKVGLRLAGCFNGVVDSTS